MRSSHEYLNESSLGQREGAPADHAEIDSLVQALSHFLEPSSRWSAEKSSAQDELPSIEDRYKVLVEQIPAVVFMAILDGGISEAYVSPQVEKVLGFSQEEWLDDPLRWYHQIHPDDRGRWSVEAAEMLASGKTLKSVYRVIARDGRIIWFHCEVSLVRKNGQPWFIHGVGFDITHLKETEQALQKEIAERERLKRLELEREIARSQQTEARLAAIVETSEDAIISKNLDGVITTWNDGAERVFGYTAAEAIGQKITIIIPPEHQDEEAQIIARLKRGERIQHFSTVRRRKDGTRLDVSLTVSPLRDASGNVIGAAKVARDITEQKRIEQALRESEERFRGMAETAADAIFRIDEHSIVLFANPAAEKVFGHKPDELIGKELTTLMPEYLREVHRAAVKRHQETGKRHLNWARVEVTGLHKNGREIPVELSLSESFSGGRRFFTGFVRDVTERKQAEDALRHSEDMFRRLAETLEFKVRERTRELEQRTVEVVQQSEELRSLSFRLLKAQDDERRRFARELHDSAGQLLVALSMNLAQIVEQAKQQGPEIAALAQSTEQLSQQLTQELRTTSYLLHPPLLDEAGVGAALGWYIEGLQKRSGLAVELSVAKDLGRLPSDLELLIFRLVQECLTNVLRHSGSKTAQISVKHSTEKIMVEVGDQGKGMSPETLAQIRSRGGGVGIRGMRERLHHFGGQMQVDSDNQGTRVNVTIPVAKITGEEPGNSAPRQSNSGVKPDASVLESMPYAGGDALVRKTA